MITFHETKFEIIGGYYFNSGRTNQINNVIKNLYDLRLKSKDYNNPAEIVIKLLMNSMYGKTIIKPVETDTIVQSSIYYFEKGISLSKIYTDSALEINVRYNS